MRLPKHAKLSEKLPSQKKQGTSSGNTSFLRSYLKIELWLAVVLGCKCKFITISTLPIMGRVEMVMNVWNVSWHGMCI